MSNKLWSEMRSAVWEAMRRTGNVTSDGADECTDRAMEAIAATFLNPENGVLRAIETATELLSEKIEALRSGSMPKTVREKKVSVLRSKRAVLGSLFEECGRMRILQIRSELASFAATLEEVGSLYARGLLDSKAVKKSKDLHNEKINALILERNALYDQFPSLRDLQKAD